MSASKRRKTTELFRWESGRGFIPHIKKAQFAGCLPSIPSMISTFLPIVSVRSAVPENTISSDHLHLVQLQKVVICTILGYLLFFVEPGYHLVTDSPLNYSFTKCGGCAFGPAYGRVRTMFRVIAACLMILLPATVQGAVVHDESVDGDFSANFASPDEVVLAPGSNLILGTIGIASGGSFPTLPTDVDGFDVFTFLVPTGQQVDKIILTNYETDDPNFTSGILLYSGNDAISSLVGTTTIGEAEINTNILALLSPGSLLGPGYWTLELREFVTPNTVYSLDINIVPVPPALLLFGSALAGLVGIRRFSRRRA